MKNVLFTGLYQQTCGWGRASRSYLRALRHSGHNITARHINITNSSIKEGKDEFADLENSRYDKYDVVIQNFLPHMFRRYGNVKNIGVSHFETTVKYNPWIRSLNLMDEIWVCSDFEKQQLIESGVTANVVKMPIPCDINKYSGFYDFPLYGHKHEYKFLFVGEYITRKNVNALVKAFHREFHVSEPVRLVIKTNLGDTDSETLFHKVSTDIDQLKTDMKLYKYLEMYKSDIIITEYLDENQLYGLYNECDCFVMPSSGEAFSIPGFDALGFGCSRIVNKNSGMPEICTNKHNYFVDSRETPATAKDRPMPHMYTTRDTWWEVDVMDLQRAMRKAYVENYNRAEKKEANIKDLESFSYKNIGQRMGEII